MNYLYFGIIVLAALFISLYFYMRNKKNSNVYTTNKSQSDDSEPEEKSEEAAEEKPEKSKTFEFNNYKFEILHYWITQKVNPNKNIDYEILKETILKNFPSLPQVLEDSTTFIQEDQGVFLKEVLGSVEYSSQAKYLLVNRGRKIFSRLRSFLIFLGFVFFVLFQIEIRKATDDYSFLYIILTVISFVLSALCAKFSKVFLDVLLMTLKPGDYIRIISEPDEAIEQKVKINQLSKNETMFNKTTVFLSKKKMICENYLSKSSKYQKTINNQICLYLTIDYLKTVYSQEAYKEYLLEKEMEVLEYICAFNPKSVSANFELASLYFETQRFDEFYEILLKCRNINGYDWIIEAAIKAYEFNKENCQD